MNSSFKRVLIKLSGESLSEEGQHGIQNDAALSIAQTLKTAYDAKIQMGIVVGGGNLFRGHELIQSMQIPRAKADEIGMIATLINGLVLQQALATVGCKAHVMSALPFGSIVQSYSYEKTQNYLDHGEIVIFVAGSGHPYFTTDTAASLRACEIGADALLKATKVDGVYSSDPKKNSDAKKYDELTYNEVLDKQLNVMDATAISLCRDNQLPILVFNMYQKENLMKVIDQKPCGTRVHGG